MPTPRVHWGKNENNLDQDYDFVSLHLGYMSGHRGEAGLLTVGAEEQRRIRGDTICTKRLFIRDTGTPPLRSHD